MSKGYLSFVGEEAQTPVLAYCIFLMLRLAALAVYLLSLFILVPVTSMCGVVVGVGVGGVCVGVCVGLVSVSTYICIHKLYKYIYTYIILPIDLSPTMQSKRWLCIDAQHEVHRLSQP